MKKTSFSLALLWFLAFRVLLAATADAIETADGPLKITPIKHASLMLEFQGKTIHIDPWNEGDYTGLPKADLILVTDVHQDHMDPARIRDIKKPGTIIVAPAAVAKTVTEAVVVNHGESKTLVGIKIEALPMYNLVRGPSQGKFYHDKGRGNGYILTVGGKQIYIAGDTECIPEMKSLRNIDIAFVPMNLPYTMPPEEAAECVKAFKPKIVYPYHYGNSDLTVFAAALKSEQGIEVRMRTWY
ncbi:MAG: MBL fold metallo-hydrolase [Acidobacteria bacterium]|nr:MBL fold metallo-hydrolase [Acidobacteriota bacterium]